MTKHPTTASVDEIAKWVRDAAAVDAWRPGHTLQVSAAAPATETRDFYFALVEAALNRARVKNYVRLVKPFRRLFRNQGAVNNSLIDAVHHLTAQTQEMKQEINELRRTVATLRRQVAASPGTDTTTVASARAGLSRRDDVGPADATTPGRAPSSCE